MQAIQVTSCFCLQDCLHFLREDHSRLQLDGLHSQAMTDYRSIPSNENNLQNSDAAIAPSAATMIHTATRTWRVRAACASAMARALSG